MSKAINEMNDDELDSLFRNAAKDHSPAEPPEGAWDDFYEQFLSSEKKDKKIFWIGLLNNESPAVQFLYRWKWIAASIIGIGILFLFFQKQHEGISKETEQTTSFSGKKKTAPFDTISRLVTVSKSDSTANEKDSTAVQIKEKEITQQTEPAQPLNPLLAMVNLSKADNNNELVPIEEKKDILSITGVPLQESIIQQQKPGDLNNNSNAIAGKDKEKPTTKRLETMQDLLNDKYMRSFNNKDEEEKTSQNRAKWQIGLVGGTNLSVTSGSFSNTPGANGGIVVQHRINKGRFSVETGIVGATMSYNVDNTNFHPNGQTVPSSVSNMNGRCTMIDVPVNVRYDVVSGKSSDAFVSTGASAMVMVNQTYSYQYGGNTVNQDVSGKGANNVTATVNVSVGYEKHFKSTSIQIAPYLKIPMGDIGYGNLSLGAVGAQISIKKSL